MSIVLWSITLISLLLIMYIISYRTGEGFVTVMPVGIGGFILLLYLLAFARGLIFISAISIGLLAFFIVYIVRASSETRYEHIKGIKSYLLDSQTLISLGLLVALAVLTSKHVSTWWDDLNFWATDAKALYFLNGFPGKYGNVSPEFGDYPPAVQLMKWWFMRLKNTYDEGLSFSGYYVMMAVFLMPLAKCFKDKNILWKLIGSVVILLIPGVCNRVWAEGTCADVAMGIVFGALLIAIIDKDCKNIKFYYSRIAIFLGVLVLCKSSGFQWAVYGVILLLCMYVSGRRGGFPLYDKGTAKYLWISIIFGGVIQSSWWIFCLFNRRIAKLTSAGVHMVGNGYTLPDNASEKAKLFMQGIIHYPMHTDFSNLINLTLLTSFIMILLFIILLNVLDIIDGKTTRILFVYALLVGIVTYAVIFLGHITIFNGETQYDTAKVIAISVSRYSCPYNIGMLMLVLYLLCAHAKSYATLIFSAVFILVTTDYSAAALGLFKYRETVKDDISNRAATIDSVGYDYIDKALVKDELYGQRVLYLRDADYIHWIKDTYISYYVSPVPTVYESFDAAKDDSNSILEMIRRTHAKYLYVDPQEEDASDIFLPFIGDNAFKYATIYKIDDYNGNISLTAIN